MTTAMMRVSNTTLMMALQMTQRKTAAYVKTPWLLQTGAPPGLVATPFTRSALSRW